VTARIATITIAIAFAALERPAAAHQTAVKYADVVVDGATVAIELRAQPADATVPLGLPDDAQPSTADAMKKPVEVARFLAAWIAVGADGAPCASAAPAIEPFARDARFLAIRWIATCPAPVDRLRLDLAAFFAIDTKHQLVLRVRSEGGDPFETIVRDGDSPVELALRGERPSTAFAWIRSGMDHIYTGFDHISFVLALLLVVVLYRGPAKGEWYVRAAVPSLRATALIVTSFTVAHSVTLIGASLGWFALDSQLVESVIALSIAYTAIENIVRPDVKWRFGLTFLFGLVHGLGFASMLAELLPPDATIVPLLLFNVGVELGQLTIVAVALPLLIVLARAVGPVRYRRHVMPALSAAIAVLGLIWLIERAAEVTILGL
jgi:hypothetical protein